MMKLYRYLVVVLVLLLLVPINVQAEEKTLGDLRRAYEDLVQKQKENQNKTDQAEAEIKRKKEAIVKAQNDISIAEGEIEDAELAIVESNEHIESLKLESEKVLLYMQQMQGQNAYVEYVSGASSMTELIMRIEAVKQVTGYIQDTITNLEIEIKRNEELKKELEEKQQKLVQQIANYETVIAQQYEKLEEYDQYANSIDEQVLTAKERYETNKKTCKDNLGKTDDSVLLSDCSKVPVNGSWMKPLTKGVITSPMGYRVHPVTHKPYSFHNALDIGGNSEGTKVFAAAAGEVVGVVKRSSCGGNKVYINVVVNGKQYTTYYYHLLQINVKAGDIVDQNTVIGTVGGYTTSTAHGGYDSCTTGAHLHYGVANGWISSRNLNVANANVIVPPGYPNSTGYRFSSRLDYYGSR